MITQTIFSGQIDYLGQDSFENIQKKIEQTLNSEAPTNPIPTSPFPPVAVKMQEPTTITTTSAPAPVKTSAIKIQVSSIAKKKWALSSLEAIETFKNTSTNVILILMVNMPRWVLHLRLCRQHVLKIFLCFSYMNVMFSLLDQRVVTFVCY